jgi:hypothetical protein
VEEGTEEGCLEVALGEDLNPTLLALKVEEGAMSQGMLAAP